MGDKNAPYSTEEKVSVAMRLAAGHTHAQIAADGGPSLTTLWRWTTDDEEFISIRQEITDAVVAANVQALRSLATKAVEKLSEALDATEGITLKVGEDVTFEETPDYKTRSITADRILKRIGEFAEHQNVNVGGSLLEKWMSELDESGDRDKAAV